MVEPSVHDRDFLALDRFMSSAPRILDIGANAGQSIASFKSMRPDSIIDSFEPNPSLRDQLSAAAAPYPTSVVLHFVGLGEMEAELVFHTPVVDGIARVQESSQFISEFDKPWIRERLIGAGGVLTFQQFTARVKVADNFGFTPDIIKLDVEGAEACVLKGMTSTLAQHSPVLLIENSDWSNVTKILKGAGYIACMPGASGTLIPFSGQRANTIYVPARLRSLIVE